MRQGRGSRRACGRRLLSATVIAPLVARRCRVSLRAECATHRRALHANARHFTSPQGGPKNVAHRASMRDTAVAHCEITRPQATPVGLGEATPATVRYRPLAELPEPFAQPKATTCRYVYVSNHCILYLHYPQRGSSDRDHNAKTDNHNILYLRAARPRHLAIAIAPRMRGPSTARPLFCAAGLRVI